MFEFFNLHKQQGDAWAPVAGHLHSPGVLLPLLAKLARLGSSTGIRKLL